MCLSVHLENRRSGVRIPLATGSSHASDLKIGTLCCLTMAWCLGLSWIQQLKKKSVCRHIKIHLHKLTQTVRIIFKYFSLVDTTTWTNHLPCKLTQFLFKPCGELYIYTCFVEVRRKQREYPILIGYYKHTHSRGEGHWPSIPPIQFQFYVLLVILPQHRPSTPPPPPPPPPPSPPPPPFPLPPSVLVQRTRMSLLCWSDKMLMQHFMITMIGYREKENVIRGHNNLFNLCCCCQHAIVLNARHTYDWLVNRYLKLH